MAEVVAPLRGRGLKQPAGTVAVESVRRSLTGAWIETVPRSPLFTSTSVAPLRGRGLKRNISAGRETPTLVAPLRGRGLKHFCYPCTVIPLGRSLTGAWIETRPVLLTRIVLRVAPLRGRGLKLAIFDGLALAILSLPYGGVD